MERHFSHIGFFLILFCLFWAPIPLASNRQWAWSLLEILLFACCSCALMAYPYLAKNKLASFSHTTALWAGLAVLPITALIQSALWWLEQEGFSFAYATQDIGRTLDVALKGVAYLAYAFAFWLLVNTPYKIKLVIAVVVLSGLFQALYGTALLLGDFDATPVFNMNIRSRATGSFVYQNHFANFLMLSAALGTGLMVGQFRNQQTASWRFRLSHWLAFIMSRKMLLRLALVMIVAGIVLSKSRMGNSAFFASLLICSVLALALYRNRPKVFTWFVLSIIAIDVALVGSWVGLEKVQQRLEETVIGEEGRVPVVLEALPAVRDKPLLGHGAGSFYTVFNQYQSQYLGGFYDHAHNDYLQFAFEYGLPTLLIAGLSVLWVAWLCIDTMMKRRTHLLQGVAFGCLMAIVGMLIHCSVDFQFQAPANTLLFITILCLAYQCRFMPRKGWIQKR